MQNKHKASFKTLRPFPEEKGPSGAISKISKIQSFKSHKIVRESRTNEIKHVQTEILLRDFTHKNHRKKILVDLDLVGRFRG